MLLLYICAFILYVFGLLNLFGVEQEYFYRHLIFGGIGLLAFFTIKKIGLPFFRVNARFFYWAFIFILIFTYIIGFEAKGSKRWIDLYFFNFQGSEFFKVFFIIFLADYYSKKRQLLTLLTHYVKSILYFILPAFIIFKQPDFSTAIIFSVIFFVMTFFSAIPKKYLLYTALIGLLLLPLGVFTLHDYQKARIMGFFNPHVDKAGTSYNMTQAIISVGSGGFAGKGLGLGPQSQLYFLPENHTDFAFSSLTEQFGFIGGAVVILLYGGIAVTLMKYLIDFYYQKDEEGQFKFFLTLAPFSW